MKLLLAIFFLFLFISPASTQDTLNDNKPIAKNEIAVKEKPIPDSSTKTKIHSPKIAATRSAIFPGLGQIYNKKYWKLPIIYGAMGVTTGIFFFNFKSYKDTRYAYKVKYNMRVFQTDSANYDNIRDDLKPLSEESLRFYRDQYRRDVDYSIVAFLILWGLNVVDAAVDAHLKSFDVSPDLSLKIKPGYSDFAKTNGISLVLTFK